MSTQSIHHADRPQPRRAAAQRGVALIMVAVLLTVIFVLAIAFVSASRMDRMAGRGHSYADAADAAVGATARHIGRLLSADRISELDGSGPAYTYPDAQHPWLSTLDALDERGNRSGNGPWTVWPHLSLIGTDFVDAATLQPLPRRTDGTVDQSLPFGIVPNDSRTWPAGENLDTFADAGGSGVADARWVRVSLPGPEGLVWLAAVRVIDNGGMVNLNTATQGTWDYYDGFKYGATDGDMSNRLVCTDLTGETPADIDLVGMLVNIPWDQTDDGLAIGVASPWDWGYFGEKVKWRAFSYRWPYYTQVYDGRSRDPMTGRWLSTNGPVNTGGFLWSMHAGPLDSATAAGRRHIWQQVGSRLPMLLNVIANNSSSSTLPTPFSFMDEAELRMRFGANVCQDRLVGYANYGAGTNVVINIPTALEWAAGQGLNADYESPIRRLGRPFLKPEQMPFDYRHLITCYNGEGQIRYNATYRSPMPGWINKAMGGLYPAKLDPNNDPIADLAALFNALLNTPTTVNSSGGDLPKGGYVLPGGYFGNPAEATRAANSLAANLVAYRNASEDSSDSAVGDCYGLEAQPFFVEATVAYVYKADPNSTATAPGVPLLMIELRNPFVDLKDPVKLNRFRLSIDGGTTTIPLPAYDLKPGQMVVLYTEGDDEFLKYLDANAVPASIRVPIPAMGPLSDAPVFCLYSSGNKQVLVDRMRYSRFDPKNNNTLTPVPGPPGRWAPRDVGPQTLAQNGYRRVFSSTLWRDTRSSGLVTGSMFFSAPKGAPCYVFEGFNQMVKQGAIDVPPGDYTKPIGNIKGFCGSIGQFSKPPVVAAPLPGVFQLHAKNAPLDSLGEILQLPTIAHLGGQNPRPFSEGAGERCFLTFTNNAPLTAMGKPYYGALFLNPDWTHFVRSDFPQLPVVLTLFDALDILGPRNNQPILPGRININTAPPKVLARLPWMHRFRLLWDNNDINNLLSVGGFRACDAMTAYRDMVALPADAPADPNGRTYKDRSLCGITDISRVPGFLSLGEPLAVRRATQDTATQQDFSFDQVRATQDWRFDRFGINGQNESTNQPDSWGQINPTPEFVADTVADDAKELALLFDRISNVITIRSDAFTASVVLQGRRLNPRSGKYEPIITRRFVAAFDRSNASSAGAGSRTLYLVMDGGGQLISIQEVTGTVGGTYTP